MLTTKLLIIHNQQIKLSRCLFYANLSFDLLHFINSLQRKHHIVEKYKKFITCNLALHQIKNIHIITSFIAERKKNAKTL